MHRFVCFPLSLWATACGPEHGGLFSRVVCNPRMSAAESCCSTEVWSRAVHSSQGRMRCKFFPEEQLSAVQAPSCSIALSCELLTTAAEDSLLSRPFWKDSFFPISCSAVLSTFRGIKLCAYFCLGWLHLPKSISSYIPLALTKIMRNE